ncbi:Kelch repeat-containing protein [Taibaiella soli]|nr:kelch repeat-containing protein [Taibaiella soli]
MLFNCVVAQQVPFNLENGNPRELYFGSYVSQGAFDSMNLPGCRRDVAMWECGGKIYTYGGSGYSTNPAGAVAQSDFWKYDPQLNAWNWLNGSDTPGQQPVYGVKGVATTSNYPGVRQVPLSWSLNGKLYLYGGNGTDELWTYDTLSGYWTWIKGNNAVQTPTPVYGTRGVADTANTPGARTASTTWVYNNKLYLLGGASGSVVKCDLWEYNPQNNSWRWIKGPSGSISIPVYGIQGMPDSANTPAAVWYNPGQIIGDKFYLFGGGVFRHWLWEYNMITNNWTWVKGSLYNHSPVYGTKNVASTANIPPPIWGSTTYTANNMLYLFGGMSSDVGPNPYYYGTLWEYNPSTNNWAWISGDTLVSKNGVYQDDGIVAIDSNVRPGSRAFSAGVMCGGKFYAFAGHGLGIAGSDTWLNDLWAFDPGSANWRFLKGYANPDGYRYYPKKGVYSKYATPGPKEQPVTWVCNGKLYLYGSHSTNLYETEKYGADVWDYDPANHQWRLLRSHENVAIYNPPAVCGTKGVEDSLNNPGIRAAATGFTYDNRLFLFGGYGFDAVGNYGYLNDIWEYNVFTNNWEWVSGDSIVNTSQVTGPSGVFSSSAKPAGRTDAVSFYVNNLFYIFGGQTNIDRANDLWAYNPATNEWCWFKGGLNAQHGSYGIKGVASSTNWPGSRYGGMGWGLNGKLYMLGGYGDDGDPQLGSYGLLDDLWEYDLSSGLWKWLKGDLEFPFTQAGAGFPSIYGTMGIGSGSTSPGGIEYAARWTDDNKLFLLGGSGYNTDNYNPEELNTQWSYDPAANKWTWVGGSQAKSPPGILPLNLGSSSQNYIGARMHPGVWNYNGTVYFYGGYGTCITPYNNYHYVVERSDMWRRNGVCSSFGMAPSGSSDTHDANSATIYSDTACGIIATVIPSGNNPLHGNVTAKVTQDNSSGSFNGYGYARRHYDLNTTSNDSMLTETMTLYFTQQDFDDFNNSNPTGPLLPTNSTDLTGISNIRVGLFSAPNNPQNSSLADYLVNPSDSNIIWNVAAGRWEVSFDDTSTGGLYVFSEDLPVQVHVPNAVYQPLYKIGDWKIWPNPAAKQLNIVFRGYNQNNTIGIYDALGRLLLNATQEGNLTSIDVSMLSPGIYVVKTGTGDAKLFIKE